MDSVCRLSTGIARPAGRQREAAEDEPPSPEEFTQRANRGERCSPECAQGSASLSTRGPSLLSTAGSSVSVAANTKMTEIMIPSAIDRKAGLGTSITAESEIRTVIPEKRTALPAVSIVSPTAAAASWCCPKKTLRKRMTMNSA